MAVWAPGTSLDSEGSDSQESGRSGPREVRMSNLRVGAVVPLAQCFVPHSSSVGSMAVEASAELKSLWNKEEVPDMYQKALITAGMKTVL